MNCPYCENPLLELELFAVRGLEVKIKGESTIQRMRSLFQISSIIPFGIFRDEKPLAFYCTNCGRLDYKLPLDRMQKLNKRIEKVQQKSTQN